MKQTKALLVAILMTLSTHAGWKQVKTLEHYGPKAFTLKKGVVYVEIRKYTKGKPAMFAGKGWQKINRVLRMYRTPLSVFGSKVKRAFKRIPIKKRYAFKKGHWSGMATRGSWYHNGFMLDNAHKTWRLENAKDVIDMIRPVDTPAEISLVLWLRGDAQDNASKYSAKYRKSGEGYLVKEHYVISNSAHGCGDYTYRYKISRSGRITQKKRISKKAIKGCLVE